MGKYIYIATIGHSGYNIEFNNILLTTDSLSMAINECMEIGKDNASIMPISHALFILQFGSSVSYSCDLYRGNVLNALRCLQDLPNEILTEMRDNLKPFIEEETIARVERENSKRLYQVKEEKELLSMLKEKYELR